MLCKTKDGSIMLSGSNNIGLMIPIDFDSEMMIDPRTFIGMFCDMEHFEVWCKEQINLDLKEIRKSFEDAEMYEEAKVVNDVLEWKYDRMVNGMLGNFD